MASIVRYKSPQTGSPSSYVVTFAVKGREVVTLSTYINSPSALLDFITQTLHLGREVAEETLTKLEREGIATIDGKK